MFLERNNARSLAVGCLVIATLLLPAAGYSAETGNSTRIADAAKSKKESRKSRGNRAPHAGTRAAAPNGRSTPEISMSRQRG